MKSLSTNPYHLHSLNPFDRYQMRKRRYRQMWISIALIVVMTALIIFGVATLD